MNKELLEKLSTGDDSEAKGELKRELRAPKEENGAHWKARWLLLRAPHGEPVAELLSAWGRQVHPCIVQVEARGEIRGKCIEIRAFKVGHTFL